jgi:glycosyltransferase involved in cell wall biosynthesis
MVHNVLLKASEGSLKQEASSPVHGQVPRILIPLVTPYLYGMERAVIEAFEALRPDVEAYIVQSSRISERNPPVIQELRKRGFQMTLLPDKSDWDTLSKPHSMRHLFRMMYALVRSNATILRAATGKNILYVPSLRAGLLSVWAALMFRARGCRIIHHFHDLGTSMPGANLWFSLVTDCIHNTEYGYSVVAEKVPQIKLKRNVVVPYILEVEPDFPKDSAASSVLEGKRNLFFIGQISKHKGVDVLLQAFNLIAHEHQDVVLHLVGGYRDDFRRQLDVLAEPGLHDRVKFWGYREDAVCLLRSAYLYVHSSPPSRFHESFGRSVVEAMAHGIPTVCFRSGALQEIVVHEQTGLICDESAAALAAALDRFLKDKDFRDTCADNAKRRYDELYSPLAVRDRWIQFFKPVKEESR